MHSTVLAHFFLFVYKLSVLTSSLFSWWETINGIKKEKGGTEKTLEQLPTSQKAVITFPFIFPSFTFSPSLITYLGENLIDTANWQTHCENFSTEPVDPN